MSHKLDKSIETMAVEDIATLFVSEFVKQNKEYLMPNQKQDWQKAKNIPFLKMNYDRRRACVERVLDNMCA